MARKKTTDAVFQLKMTLQEIKPEIWRRLLVPGDIRLDRLHMVIQEAMGWTNSHLHMFELRDRRFGDPRTDEGELELEDERKFKLSDLIGSQQSIKYEYDFGDGWEHDLLVERVVDADHRLHYPLCIAGARACPPEDCGGTGGYENMLEILKDPENGEHDDQLTWVGGFFDPEGFDVNRTNRAIREQR